LPVGQKDIQFRERAGSANGGPEAPALPGRFVINAFTPKMTLAKSDTSTGYADYNV